MILTGSLVLVIISLKKKHGVLFYKNHEKNRELLLYIYINIWNFYEFSVFLDLTYIYEWLTLKLYKQRNSEFSFYFTKRFFSLRIHCDYFLWKQKMTLRGIGEHFSKRKLWDTLIKIARSNWRTTFSYNEKEKPEYEGCFKESRANFIRW